jgi:hypothetical protein
MVTGVAPQVQIECKPAVVVTAMVNIMRVVRPPVATERHIMAVVIATAMAVAVIPIVANMGSGGVALGVSQMARIPAIVAAGATGGRFTVEPFIAEIAVAAGRAGAQRIADSASPEIGRIWLPITSPPGAVVVASGLGVSRERAQRIGARTGDCIAPVPVAA